MLTFFIGFESCLILAQEASGSIFQLLFYRFYPFIIDGIVSAQMDLYTVYDFRFSAF